MISSSDYTTSRKDFSYINIIMFAVNAPGPNGIVYVSASSSSQRGDSAAECGTGSGPSPGTNDYLLIGLGSTSNRLLKVNATTAFLPPVEINVTENAGILSQLDGLVLASSGDSSTLFAAGNGVNSVFALTSSDNWHSATLRATFNAHCPQNQPSALALVDTADVACYCTNGFGPAPYPLTMLTEGPGEPNLLMIDNTSPSFMTF